MNAFVFSRPMFFLVGMIAGAGSASCVFEMCKPKKELKGMERLNFGKEQLKKLALYCKENGLAKLLSLLPEKSTGHDQPNENAKKEDASDSDSDSE